MTEQKKQAATRIYKVRDPDEARLSHLVRASSEAAAIKAVYAPRCCVASQDDIAELVSKGVKIEQAAA